MFALMMQLDSLRHRQRSPSQPKIMRLVGLMARVCQRARSIAPLSVSVLLCVSLSCLSPPPSLTPTLARARDLRAHSLVCVCARQRLRAHSISLARALITDRICEDERQDEEEDDDGQNSTMSEEEEKFLCEVLCRGYKGVSGSLNGSH